MHAREIEKILRENCDLSRCIGAYQDPYHFMIRGETFGIYVANDCATAFIGQQSLSIEELVQLLSHIAPANLNVGHEGEALVISVGDILIRVQPDPRGLEAANINLADPFDVLVL
jgi:hypothetical protein